MRGCGPKTDRAATRIPPPGGLPAGSVSAGPAPPEATGKLPPASRLGSMVEMRSDANPEGAACLRIASCRLLLPPPHKRRVLPQGSRGPLDRQRHGTEASCACAARDPSERYVGPILVVGSWGCVRGGTGRAERQDAPELGAALFPPADAKQSRPFGLRRVC